jgi:hypothetical protein
MEDVYAQEAKEETKEALDMAAHDVVDVKAQGIVNLAAQGTVNWASYSITDMAKYNTTNMTTCGTIYIHGSTRHSRFGGQWHYKLPIQSKR